MSRLEEYLEKANEYIYDENFESKKATEIENCKKCKFKSNFQTGDASKKLNNPKCKLHGLKKGDAENCIDFEPENNE